MTSLEERQQKAQALYASGYLRTLEQLAKHFTAPIWWHSDDGPMRNGTMCFFRTPTRLLGITAGHVLAGFREYVTRHAGVSCQLGGTDFDPETRVIDYDKYIDLATFDLDETIVQQADPDAVVHTSPVWPPDLPEERDLILVGGWPGHERIDEGGRVSFGFEWFATVLDRSRSEKLCISLKLDQAVSLTGLSQDDLKKRDFGGFSGGPVLLLRESPVVTLSVVGFVSEGQAYELISARPAILIRADGTIDRGLVP